MFGANLHQRCAVRTIVSRRRGVNAMGDEGKVHSLAQLGKRIRVQAKEVLKQVPYDCKSIKTQGRLIYKRSRRNVRPQCVPV